MTPNAILFSDPNCPFCYATEERLHRLGLQGAVQWCGVQHAPHLPVPMAPADHILREQLPAEVRGIRDRAPEVAITVPRGKPNTSLAIHYGAAALMADPVAGRAFVHSLYRALWTDGADLSNPAVLARLADDAGLTALEADATALAVTDGWQRAWQRTGLGGVPLLVRHDGRLLRGLVDTDDLRAFLARAPGDRSGAMDTATQGPTLAPWPPRCETVSSTLSCAELVHVSVGPVAELPFRHGTVPSGIAKRPVRGPVQVGRHGLVGDAQGDTVRHGGPDKALLAYAAEHYSAWRDELGPLAPAAFGENLTTLGLLEDTVVLGDVYAVGTALVQATQPRRPCYKLGAHLGRPDLPRLVQATGRTGIYLRVLREGQIAARDAIRLVHRPRHGLTAAQVHHTMNVDRADLRAARRLLHHADLLPESWVRTLTRRLAGVLEDQTDRLSGPEPGHRPPHLQTPPPPGTTRGCP